MAGKRIVTPQELETAAGILAEKQNLILSKGESGSLTLMPGDVLIKIEDGRPKASSPEIQTAIMEILMEMVEAPISTRIEDRVSGKVNTLHSQERPVKSQMARSMIPVRDMQVAEMTFDDIRNFICPAASEKDAYMFLKLCQARNLNPFTGEAYLIPYKTKDGEIKCSMIVGKEAIMRKAEQNPQYRGFKAGVIVSKGDDLIYREGQFVRKNEVLEGGWAEVFRADRDHPVRKEVALSEYDTGIALWKTKPATMISKVADVQAHRAAFPSDLAGCYSSDEMGIDPEREVTGAQ